MNVRRDKLGRFLPGPRARTLPATSFRSGDVCPRCGGWIGIYRSIVVAGERRRYVRCTTPSCGYNPGGAWVDSTPLPTNASRERPG